LGGIVGFRYLHRIFGLYLCDSCRREAGWMEIEGILAVIGGGGRFSYIPCTHLFVLQISVIAVPPSLPVVFRRSLESTQHSLLSEESP